MAVATTDRTTPLQVGDVDTVQPLVLTSTFLQDLLFGWVGGAGPVQGSNIYDLTRGDDVALYENGDVVTTPRGAVLDDGYESGSSGGAAAQVPEYIKVGWPVTFTFVARWDGTSPTTNAQWWGVNHNDSDNSPYVSWVVQEGGGDDTLELKVNDNGSFSALLTFPESDLPTDEFFTVTAVVTSSSEELYLNGTQKASGSTSKSDPTYGSTASYGLGAQDGTSRTTRSEYQAAFAWDRALSAAEVDDFSKEALRLFPTLLNRRTEQQLYVSSSGTTVTESAQLNATASLSAAETGTATESASVDSTASLAAADTAVATESAAITAAAALSAQETAKALETATITPTASFSATETATAKETATILANASLSAAETGIATETAQVNVTASLTANETRGDVPQGRVSTVGENKASLLSGGANTTEQIGRQGNQVQKL